MADPETFTVPEDPDDALQLAEACLASVAGRVVTDSLTLPDEWYRRYGTLKQILINTGEVAHNTLDALPRAIGGRELYVDDLGEEMDVHAVLGEWIVHTNAALASLETAVTSLDRAQNRIGRIGVHGEETSP